MTIDPLLNPAALRLEKGGIPFAQLSAVEGDAVTSLTEKSAFSSVLGALTDQDTDILDPADPADPAAAGALLAVSPADALALPTPVSVLALDSAAVLAQLTQSFRPEVATLTPGPTLGEAAEDLPGVPTGAVITRATGMQRQGVGAALSDAGEEAGGQAPDLRQVSSPVVPAPARRQLPVGLQNGTLAATLSEGAMARAGDGQRGAQEVAGTIRADWRAAAAMAERAVFTTAPWSDSASGGFRALPASRGSDRASGRAMFLPLDVTAPGSMASSSYSTPLAAGAVPMATADAPMAPGASSDVAHKVHYWVTRGVQTAELQLDTLGGSAVDVSITLQGKEALVEFRSDQPEARRVLQEAMPQLRDMLRAEGLQLAGGFVGSSAQQKEGDARRDGGHREPERVGTASASAADAVRIGGGRAASAHSLDVFV